jgi:hypothetical protein
MYPDLSLLWAVTGPMRSDSPQHSSTGWVRVAENSSAQGQPMLLASKSTW